MTTTTKKTRAILRRFCGEVIALFPDIDAGRGLCMSYMHIGQHGGASRTLARVSRPVDLSEHDAAALVRELTSLGYDLQIIQRMPHRQKERLDPWPPRPAPMAPSNGACRPFW